ncbi:hypothetical protein [Lysobacter sp. Root916]|uniref:hypothetical protein n=1 Tax=Lysobacter sp. Root916 TaxID=1736606 RepID=UPI0012F79003|nr:hypothetical protein [Lysobacter sp. Root916]
MDTGSSSKPQRLRWVFAAVVGLVVGLAIGRFYGSLTRIAAPVPVKNAQVSFDAKTGKGMVTAEIVDDSLGMSFGYLLQAMQATCLKPPVALTSMSPFKDGNEALRPGTIISVNFECRWPQNEVR